MRREALALSQTKDELRHFYGIAHLVAPVRCQRLDHRAHGWFIVRKQNRRVLVRANAPICPHSPWFEGTHLDAKRRDFLCQRFGKSSNRPLGSMVAGTARTGQAAAHGGDLKDVTAPLLAHDRKRSAGHINDAIEICVHQRLESLRTQLLERSDVAVSSVIYDDIEASESVDCHLHRCLRRLFVSHVERNGANLIAILIHQIVEAARVSGGCHEAMTSGPASLLDVWGQFASAVSYQPDIR